MPAFSGGGTERRLGAVALSVLMACGSASAESMQDALVSAYAANAQLQAERANLRATDENVPQALSNWRPTVTLSASQGIEHINEPGIPFTPSSTDLRPSNVGVTIAQPIWRGGRTEAQTSQALNQVRSERANLVATEQTVFLTVVTDYMNVVEGQAVVDLNVNNEQVLRRQLEATRDEFQVGEVTRTDVAQAEASYAQAIASRQSAEGTLQVYRASFEHDVGHAPGGMGGAGTGGAGTGGSGLAAPPKTGNLPATRDEALGLAQSGAPTVVKAGFDLVAAEDNVRLVRGALLPTISLQGSVSRATDQSFPGTKSTGDALTAQLSMPLYEGGSIYSQSRAAQQQVSQRRHLLDDARQLAVQNAAQAWDHLQATRATLVSLEAQVRAAEIALEGVRQEQAVGSRTILDVLNQEQALFQARVNLVQSQHDEVVYQFTLMQATGRLTAEALGLPVEYYDPDKNFELVRDKWIGFGTSEE